jgi:hypothetical protein
MQERRLLGQRQRLVSTQPPLSLARGILRRSSGTFQARCDRDKLLLELEDLGMGKFPPSRAHLQVE